LATPLVLVENETLTGTHGWQQSWVFVLIRDASLPGRSF
jgi:hypothetical protein